MKHRLVVALITLILIGAVGPDAVSFAAERLEPLPAAAYASPLSQAARLKVDPALALAVTRADKALTPSALAPLARQIVILGESVDDLRYPVIIKTTLSDAELAALGAPPDTRVGQIVTSIVRARDLDRVASHPGVKAIEASRWMQPNLDESIPDVRADEVNHGGTGSFTGDGVIYGILDTGIDVTHADFQDAGGNTRILAIWDHFVAGGGTPPAGFDYGHEFTQQMIDNGQANQHQDTAGHGTHVAGTSVGNGLSLAGTPYRGVAWEADIIAVRNNYCDLFCYGGGSPVWGQVDTRGSIDGLDYLIQKAQALGMPLVVNQSQGVMMGPHDGTTLLEQAYDTFVDEDGLILCVAAGNDQDADWHGRATVNPGGDESFTLTHDTSQQDPLAFVFFECWYDNGDQFTWTITTPSGNYGNLPTDTGGQVPGLTTSHSDTIYYYTDPTHPVNNQGYGFFMMQNRTNGVESGDWTLDVAAANGLPAGGQVDLYCERNQYNFTVTSNLSTEAIVGMPGTASGVITVAAYNTKIEWTADNGSTYDISQYETLHDLASFSSWGPRRDGAQKPDIGAPGQMIASAWSAHYQVSEPIIAPGREHVLLQGTSMACPHVAGAIALMLEADPNLTPAEVKTILQNTARSDSYTGTVPNDRFGYGKLDVKAAVDEVSGGTSGCNTQDGDATEDNQVNVLDIVAVVNDILGITPLSPGGEACADIVDPQGVNIQDVVGIVNIILAGKAPVWALWKDAAPEPVAWSESADGGTYRLSLDGGRLGGVQMAFVPPRGYEPAGDPVLHGAAPGAQLDWNRHRKQYQLIAYTLGGPLSADGSPVTLEIPLVQLWDGGQSLRDFAVTNLVLADTEGRPLALKPEADLPLPGEDSIEGGVRMHLSHVQPNPAGQATKIGYSLPHSGPVRIEIFDANGRRVRTLWDGWQMAGDHRIAWDARDGDGQAVAGGTYFLHVASGGEAFSRKVTIVR
ncbi:MAG: S8 family serine peptidase [Candidatus Eisenbacteria bacterium]|nr:S8 family serine peptidase [Candidatus Eisenbacteria bacterium]